MIAEIMIYIWISLFVLAIIFEVFTSELVSIWFAAASIPSFILALFEAHPIIQVVVFLIVSFILLLLTRPIVMKYVKTNEIKTNVDSYVGAVGIVIEKLVPGIVGQVKVKNLQWSAISNDTIEVGESVRVLDIEGVKLIVEKY